jgi:DNA invertase Pin-like site-specific DNA recombinase
MVYGCARVSTDGQSVAAQVQQLMAAGCVKVCREVASGAETDRAQLRRALAKPESGDVLMVTQLHRLARSTRDLLKTLASVATVAVRTRVDPGSHERGARAPRRGARASADRTN